MRVRSQQFDPRQTMRSAAYEVFHYKDPSTSAVEVHHHDFYEVYFLLDGNVEYWVDGRIIRMEPGDLLLISPMELHRPMVAADSPAYERIVLWINKDYLKTFASAKTALHGCFDTTAPNHTHLLRTLATQRTLITQLLADLVREYYSREFGSQLSADGIFLQFMVQLNRLAQHANTEKETSQELSPLTQKVIGYIHAHIGEKLSLESLADRFFVSKYHLSHAFSREVGVSVYRYVLLRRLLIARQMLSAGESAGSVSRICGFADYTSFYRAFKSEYGISPRAYSAKER